MSRISIDDPTGLRTALAEQRRRNTPQPVTKSQFVNPSGPALDRRAANDQGVRDQGLDPDRLRTTLQERRTNNQATLRRRRSLGLKAREMELAGDRSGAELVRAQIAELEGGRMTDAREIAQDSRFLRSGGSRGATPDRLARLGTQQEIAQARTQLAADTQRGQVQVQRDGLDATLADSAANRNNARFEQAASAEAVTDQAATTDDRRAAAILAAENDLSRIQFEQAQLADAVENAPEDADLQRELQRSQIDAQRVESELAAARAGTELAAEQGTGGARVATAVAGAERERALAEGRSAGGGRPGLEETGIDPESELARAGVDGVIDGLTGIMRGGATGSDQTVRTIETIEARINSVARALPTAEQRRAYARLILAEIDAIGELRGNVRDSTASRAGVAFLGSIGAPSAGTTFRRFNGGNLSQATTKANQALARIDRTLRQLAGE